MERIIVVPDSITELKYSMTETTWVELKVLLESNECKWRRVNVAIGEESTTIVPSGGDSVNFGVISTAEGKIFVRVAHNTKKNVYRIEIDDLK